MAPHCKDIKLYLSTLLPSASTVITKEELDQWSNTASRIGSHFMGYKAFEGAPAYDGGTMISSEVIADAEGVKAALMIAKDYENFQNSAKLLKNRS